MAANVVSSVGQPKVPAVIDLLYHVIHEPARLRIMTNLWVVDSGGSVDSMRATGPTRGLLSSHMTHLEVADCMEVTKKSVKHKPPPILQLTDRGREAFDGYHAHMERASETSK